MKETFVDAETGWIVTRETVSVTRAGEDVIEETITNPQTGEQEQSTHLASYQCSVAERVRKSAEWKVLWAESDRKRQQRLHRMYPEMAAGADLPAGALGKIKLSFADCFAMWDICLPEHNVASRRRGKILKEGWVIWYLFGSDERGEYLDYLAYHRMTSDSHVRIYADGLRENLPAYSDLQITSDDPQENARLKADYHAYNQQVSELLKAKHFDFTWEIPDDV